MVLKADWASVNDPGKTAPDWTYTAAAENAHAAQTNANTAAIASTSARHAITGKYHVDTYGAVGNGSTDDTTAIQNCVNAALAASGTAYFTPGKTYKITAAITMGTALSYRWTIEGNGATLLQATDNTPILKFVKEGTYGWRISGLKFLWSSAQTSSDTLGIGVYFDSDTNSNYGFYNCELENLFFDNGFRGISTNESGNANPVWGADIHHIFHSQRMSGAAIRLRCATGAPNNTLRHVYMRGDLASEPLLELSNHNNLLVQNIEFNECTSVEMFVEACDAVTISGIRSESGTYATNYDGMWWFSGSRARIDGVYVGPKVFNVTNWAYIIRATGSGTSLEVGNVSANYLTISGGEVALISGNDVADIQFVGAFLNGGGDTITKLYPWDATATHVSNDGGQPFSVKRYGATGDGSTDDTAAIQAAIDLSPAGSDIYFPRGTYLVSAPIVLLPDRAYVGEGHAYGESACIKQKAGSDIAAGALLVSHAWSSNAGSCEGPVRIENLAVDGNSGNNTGAASGILLVNYWSTIRSCYVHHTTAHGIELTDVTADTTVIDNSCSENRIHDCKIAYVAGDGIHQVSQNTISNQDGYCVDTIISNTDGHGVSYERASGWTFRRLNLYGIAKNALNLQNCYATLVSENYVEDYGNEATAAAYYGGINLTQLDGRGSHIIGNFIGCFEPSDGVGAYDYIVTAAGVDQTDARIVMANNICQAPAGTSKGVGLVGVANSGGHLYLYNVGSNAVAGINTPSYYDANTTTT